MAYHGVINSLAKSTFAVLLIHDDPLVREFLWGRVVKIYDAMELIPLWIYIISVALMIWFVCILIDKIVACTIKKMSKKIFSLIRHVD